MILQMYLEYNPKYYLIKSTWGKSDLYEQVESSTRDLFIILPISFFIVINLLNKSLLLTDDTEIRQFYSSPVAILKIPLTIFIGYVWRMIVHMILHHPSIYRYIHKYHHVRPEKMTTFSSHTDHPLEFIFMEVIGTYILPIFLNPCPNIVMCVQWCFHAIQGIIDHSNSKIPQFKIDSEYHFYHHKMTVYNFAEFEFLDKITGTLYVEKSK